MKNVDLYHLFELSPVPMWVFDVASLCFLDVNTVAIAEYGYTKDEFLQMTINNIRPVEDVPIVGEIVKANAKTGSFFKNVFRHVRKSGEQFYVQIASSAVSHNGKPARLVVALDVNEKFEAQQALIANERRFKALVQDGSDMITIIDHDFRYRYVSPASQRVFGVEPAYFIGKKAFDFIHADDFERVNREAVEIWTKRSIQLSPYRYRDVSGAWLWVETKATNLFDDPAVAGIVCTSRDITERKKAEQEVAENVERFKIVSKATSDVIWDYDLLKGKILWNRALKGILKYEQKETTLNWWKQNIHPLDRKRVIEKIEKHIDQGIARWTDEYRFLCGDGTYKNIFDRGFLMTDTSGKVHRMIGAMQDITVRKREEEWSKLLESVVVNTSDGVLITDASGPEPLIIYVNQAMVAMSGYTREELIGNYPDILHGTDTTQPNLKKLKLAVKSRTATKVELVNYTKQGRQYHVSISLTPVFQEDGELVRWISIQRDVSEQRRYVEQIEQTNKRLQDISWLQSHVVRTPLARIMSLMELFETTDANPEQCELLNHMRISANELDNIIRQIANHPEAT